MEVWLGYTQTTKVITRIYTHDLTGTTTRKRNRADVVGVVVVAVARVRIRQGMRRQMLVVCLRLTNTGNQQS